jgi:hypothetical protein
MEEFREQSDEHLVEWLRANQISQQPKEVKAKVKLPALKYLIVVPPVMVAAFIAYLIIRDGSPIKSWEIKCLIGVATLSLLLIILTITLLRNAVVSNTKCLVQLKKSISNWEKVSMEFSRDLKSNATSMNKTADSNNRVTDALVAVTAKILDIVTNSVK